MLQVIIPCQNYLFPQTHILNLKEELESERTIRAKVERERGDLAQDLEDLNQRLEEAGGTSLAQMEITKQQEARFQKLRHDMEETTRHFETTSASLKKRHAESLAELEGQVEHLQQARQVLEQDKSDLQLQVDDLLTRVDQMARAKVDIPKHSLLTSYMEVAGEGKVEKNQINWN